MVYFLPPSMPPTMGKLPTPPPFFPSFFPPPSMSLTDPRPNPPSSLLIPRPPSRPLTRPPRPRPLSSLPTRPSTPVSSRPTAAMIWNSGSVSKPQSGLSFFLAWGMSLIFFFALSIVVTTEVVSSLRESASLYSSGDASPVCWRPLA
jgi:hypothetical protein